MNRRPFARWTRFRPGLATLAGTAAAVSTLLQILVPPVLGLADNGDYKRLLRPLGLTPVVAPGNSPSFKYIWLHYAPVRAGGGGYASSEFALVHVVRRLSVMLGFGQTFDMRLVAVAHAVVLGLAVGLLVRALPGSPRLRAITALLVVVAITDTRFTVYLDSFFTEPSSLLALLFLIAAVLHAWRRPTLSPFALLAIALSGAALITSKSQNAPLVVVPVVVLLARRVAWGKLAGRWKGRLPGAVCAVLLLTLGTVYLHDQPSGFSRINRYDAVFVEVLGYSPNPAADLKNLGLSPELAKYAGHPVYDHLNALHDPNFAGFFSKITEAKLAEFYLTHPGRALSLAHRGATASMYLRPVGISPPLGNQTLASGAAAYKTTCRLCLYSTVSQHLRSASAILVPALWLAALAAALALRRGRRRDGDAAPDGITAVLLMLLAFAVVSMAIALLGEGEYEIVKHLYLTSVCNALLAVLTLHASGLLISRRRRAGERKAGSAAPAGRHRQPERTGASLLALVALFAVTACGSGSGKTPAKPPPTSAQPAAHLTGQVVVHVPKKHGAIGVVVLHSFEHGPSEPIAQGWNGAADRHGFVAIYPSRGADWNAGLCCGTAMRTNRDDVRWLNDAIRQSAAKYHLTTIYLAGDSNGGMMVERLVAQDPSISSRFVVWGAAPEFETVSVWKGSGFLLRGAGDASAPEAGGIVRLAGEVIHINPTSETRRDFPDAHLTFVTLPRLGHAPPSGWPDIAWHALETGTALPA